MIPVLQIRVRFPTDVLRDWFQVFANQQFARDAYCKSTLHINSRMLKHSIIIALALTILNPTERAIYKKVTSKWLAYLLTFIIGVVVLLSMHLIAYWLGF